MPRPLRIQVPGGLYHVTAHCNTGRLLFCDDAEHDEFLSIATDLIAGRAWSCRAYCLLTTHYHLLVETPEPDLAAGMRYLNGCYAQRINWRRGEKGHLFEGRYHAVMAEGDEHRTELQRYIAMNPVRASLVARPEDWRWSSYRALLGLARAPAFLDVEGALLDFAGRDDEARARLRSFVEDALLSSGEDEIGKAA